jgi:hypothetical protein
VTNDSYPDIFFGLKGGFNNFGVVTKFTMHSHPQTLVYGGLLVYIEVHQFDKVLTALINFRNNNKDPKAQVLFSFSHQTELITIDLILFYDAPTPPENLFKEFTDISHIDTLKTRSFLAFVKSVPVSTLDGKR